MSGRSYQDRVGEWVVACFGRPLLFNRRERSRRFIEEALELVQAAGLTRDDVLELVVYVYGRPIGDLSQEVGGVMNCLASLCIAADVDMDDCAEREMQRVWAKMSEIRAKHQAKIAAGVSERGGLPRVATEAEAQRGLNDTWPGDPYP